MIRITIHHADDELVIELEGLLVGPWVSELERCWLDAQSLLGARRLYVDLRGVCQVDGRGRDLLARLYADGAQFVASGCVMPEVVREIAAGNHHLLSERA